MKADKLHVKSIVTMQDVLSAYGIRCDKNRIPCPIHGGKNPKFYYKEQSWICYSKCAGDNGDIFTFVERMNDCDFQEALDWICSRFNIPNDGEDTPEQRREYERILAARKAATAKRQRDKERQDYIYYRICSYLRWLRVNAPESAHIQWCDRALDRIFAGEPVFMDVNIDDRIRGMYQQHGRLGD